MKAGVDILSAAAAEAYERDFIGDSKITVRREGQSRVRHIFTVNGRTIARLKWRGMRRAVYEAEGQSFDINVGTLGRRIAIISEDGGESFLVERSSANPHREGLRAEMAEGDNFRVRRLREGRLRSEASFAIHKEFYTSTLLVFRFSSRRRTQTTALIEVKPVMKWEARFIHRLMALTVCRIILERRNSGAKPLRVKEDPHSFVTPALVKQRRRLV
jgi:hypothetical protein